MNKKSQVFIGSVDFYVFMGLAILIFLFAGLFWAFLQPVESSFGAAGSQKLILEQNLIFTLNYEIDVLGIKMTLRDYIALISSGKDPLPGGFLEPIADGWVVEEGKRYYFRVDMGDNTNALHIGTRPEGWLSRDLERSTFVFSAIGARPIVWLLLDPERSSFAFSAIGDIPGNAVIAFLEEYEE